MNSLTSILRAPKSHFVAALQMAASRTSEPGPIADARVPGAAARPALAIAPRAGADSNREAREALALVVRTLEQSADGLTPTLAREGTMREYQTLHLMDDKGRWTVPALAAHEAALLPGDLDTAGMRAFIDRIGRAAQENPYLMKFLGRARGADLSRLQEKVRTEGAEVLPRVLLHAQVLDRLTEVMADDYKVSQACREHWKRFESNPAFRAGLNAFQKAKLASVNLGIDKYNEIQRTGKVDPNTLRFILPLNIMEAVAADIYHGTLSREGAGSRQGHRGNAYAGWILATHGPQGEGPATMSPDGKMVELKQKAVKSWDDLYATWNMDFVTMAADWPYYMAKLVIPQVNDYKDRPEEYINKRALALHVAMEYVALSEMDGRAPRIDWTDPALSNLWGVTNAENARDYAARADG